MILFKNFRLYTQTTDGIRFQQNSKLPYMITYFSENSTLYDDYEKLNLKWIDANIVVTTYTKVPRTTITPIMKKLFAKKYKLYLYSIMQRVPQHRNFILDFSTFLQNVDHLYKPTNYRMRSGTLIKTILMSTLGHFNSDSYKKVLIYSIDLNKPVHPFINQKIYLLWQMLKNETFPFDDLVVCVINNNKVRYRLFVKDGVMDINRITILLRQMKHIDVPEETDDMINQDEISSHTEKKIDNIATNVLMNVAKNIKSGSLSKVKSTIKDFLIKDHKTFNLLNNIKSLSSHYQEIPQKM